LFGSEKPSGAIVIGRLRRDLSFSEAQAALTVWIRRQTEQLPEAERAIQATLVSQATPASLDSEIALLFLPLGIAFGLVLVICCANVSNMMLARALARQKEIGVRLALGAARGRLIRQLLSENLSLALLAGAVGFAISLGAVSEGQRLLAATLPAAVRIVLHIEPLQPDYRVFFFILGAAALSAILFGLAPALQATRTSLTEALRGEFGAKISSSRLRSLLVVSQISVCLILLVLTGILVRGSGSYRNTDLGYNHHGVVYPLFLGRGVEAAELPKLADRLSMEPWIDQWAAAWHAPLRSVDQIVVTPAPGTQTFRSGYNIVSPEYFQVLEIPIVRGRNFSAAEADSEAAAAIVNQSTARKFWPDGDALGKSIVLKGNPPTRAVVIGIAKDVISGQIFTGRDSTMIYLPTSRHATRVMTFLIRGKGDVYAPTRQLERTLDGTLPHRPVISISLDEMFFTQAYPFMAAAWISAMLGGLALLLTLSGMYGVLSYLVGQRTKEIGIRIALGATPRVVVRLILNQSLRFAVWGVSIGLVLAFGGVLLLRHFLTLINGYDFVSYAAAAAIVLVAALASAFFPSNRAARINPMETLRAD
jgi:predicted permease